MRSITVVVAVCLYLTKLVSFVFLAGRDTLPGGRDTRGRPPPTARPHRLQNLAWRGRYNACRSGQAATGVAAGPPTPPSASASGVPRTAPRAGLRASVGPLRRSLRSRPRAVPLPRLPPQLPGGDRSDPVDDAAEGIGLPGEDRLVDRARRVAGGVEVEAGAAEGGGRDPAARRSSALPRSPGTAAFPRFRSRPLRSLLRPRGRAAGFRCRAGGRSGPGWSWFRSCRCLPELLSLPARRGRSRGGRRRRLPGTSFPPRSRAAPAGRASRFRGRRGR